MGPTWSKAWNALAPSYGPTTSGRCLVRTKTSALGILREKEDSSPTSLGHFLKTFNIALKTRSRFCAPRVQVSLAPPPKRQAAWLTTPPLLCRLGLLARPDQAFRVSAALTFDPQDLSGCHTAECKATTQARVKTKQQNISLLPNPGKPVLVRPPEPPYPPPLKEGTWVVRAASLGCDKDKKQPKRGANKAFISPAKLKESYSSLEGRCKRFGTLNKANMVLTTRFSSKGAARLALSVRIYCSICLCAVFCNLVQLTSSQAGREKSSARRPRPRLGEESARLSQENRNEKERSRNGSSFLKSQRERRQRQRKKKERRGPVVVCLAGSRAVGDGWEILHFKSEAIRAYFKYQKSQSVLEKLFFLKNFRLHVCKSTCSFSEICDFSGGRHIEQNGTGDEVVLIAVNLLRKNMACA
eukprot:bmy_02076T0